MPFRINFRIMLTRSLMRVTSCGKVFNASKSARLLPSRSPDLNFSQSKNFSAATALLSTSHSSNKSYLFAHSHSTSSLHVSLQPRICTNQLSQRLCSSSTPPSTPQQKLGELKVEKMQLSYTCKVTPAKKSRFPLITFNTTLVTGVQCSKCESDQQVVLHQGGGHCQMRRLQEQPLDR